MVMKNCKRRIINLSVACINYTKAYDMLPRTWILQCLKIVNFANNISTVIENSMKNWKLKLASGGEKLDQVKINRGIFQGDTFLPILFVITLIPLTILLSDMKAEYMLGEFRGKLITQSLG